MTKGDHFEGMEVVHSRLLIAIAHKVGMTHKEIDDLLLKTKTNNDIFLRKQKEKKYFWSKKKQ